MGGRAVTDPALALAAVVLPLEFVAVTTTRTILPTSLAVDS